MLIIETIINMARTKRETEKNYIITAAYDDGRRSGIVPLSEGFK